MEDRSGADGDVILLESAADKIENLVNDKREWRPVVMHYLTRVEFLRYLKGVLAGAFVLSGGLTDPSSGASYTLQSEWVVNMLSSLDNFAEANGKIAVVAAFRHKPSDRPEQLAHTSIFLPIDCPAENKLHAIMSMVYDQAGGRLQRAHVLEVELTSLSAVAYDLKTK